MAHPPLSSKRSEVKAAPGSALLRSVSRITNLAGSASANSSKTVLAGAVLPSNASASASQPWLALCRVAWRVALASARTASSESGAENSLTKN